MISLINLKIQKQACKYRMEREKEKNNLIVKKSGKPLHQVSKDNTHSGESC